MYNLINKIFFLIKELRLSIPKINTAINGIKILEITYKT